MNHLFRFSKAFRLPRSRSANRKASEQWFADRTKGEHNMKAFASEQLGTGPIVNCFLQDVVSPMGIMPDHCRCFALLEELLSLLSAGADSAVAYIDRITRIIDDHGALYAQLYPDQVRPKFHHVYHIPEGMLHLNKLLSCFVLERKHRSTKDAAEKCFRFIEYSDRGPCQPTGLEDAIGYFAIPE